MEIDRLEGFEMILDAVTLAKELHDAGRADVIKAAFFDVLSYDTFYESVLGVISSVFSGFHNDYIDNEECEIMVFSDDVISEYFYFAWEYGRNYKIPYTNNPLVKAA